MFFLALQTKLNEEKVARQKAEQNSQEKERQISMLSVDYRQIQQRLQKLEGEYRQVLHSKIASFCFVIMHVFYRNRRRWLPCTASLSKSSAKRVV